MRKQLGEHVVIHYPIVEHPDEPSYQHWHNMLAKEFTKLPSPVILMGHSLGSSVLLKYLSENEIPVTISAMFLVATPHWGKNLAEFMLKKEFEKSLPITSPIHFYQSKNDPVVPFRHVDFYREALPHAIVRELTSDDHTFAEGIPQLVSDVRDLL
nr:alpha/beta hydrolase [Chryseolinea lacunae]